MAGKNLTTKTAKELLAKGRVKERAKHEKSQLKEALKPLRFKVGDRVWILTLTMLEGEFVYKQQTPPVVGTVESVPKTLRGCYTVRIEGMPQGLQSVTEDSLALVEQNTAMLKCDNQDLTMHTMLSDGVGTVRQTAISVAAAPNKKRALALSVIIP
jgi:hypothetical protein